MRLGSPPRTRTVAGPELARARADYDTYGCAQLDDVVDVVDLRTALHDLYAGLVSLGERRMAGHEVGPGTLTGGFRFTRIDPATSQPEAASRISEAFTRSGLAEWAAALAGMATPWLAELTGYRLTYDRPFLLAYREGDYIGPHGDQYDGHRVNVQLPLAYGCVCGMRVLRDGFLETHYDRDGCLRVLGPRMWHEVPALLRQHPDVAPLRLVLSLRLAGTPQDPSRPHHGQAVRP